MDVHRSRFVPYPTSDISALAFSRSSDSGYTPNALPALKLAIGRADGTVEIWNPLKGTWVQETVLHGSRQSVAALAWTQDPDETGADGHTTMGQQRLFSIASSPAVIEWDLARGEPLRRSTGNFSEVWCFAVQPRPRMGDTGATPPCQEIVAGCGDGTMVLLSTADDDLQFKRILARVGEKKASCMCVTYQKQDVVVAGFADSIIRIFDTKSCSVLRSMSVGTGIPGAPKTPIVWQVKCLPTGDIVSGDSNGEVRFWDGRMYSLLQRVSGPDGDCVDLIISSDGKTVVSGNLSGKMAVFKQASDSRKSWGKISHRRIHDSEVKGMAAFDSKGMSVFVSGGSGAAPLVVPLREYGKENMRWLSSLPQDPPLASAPKARLLASWWERDIYIWRIARQTGDTDELDGPQSPHRLVSRVTLADGQPNIRHASISADGKLLAVSTSSVIKLFLLRPKPDGNALAVRKLKLPYAFSRLGARMLSFSPDGKWLATVTPSSEVYIARLATSPDRPKQMYLLSKIVELDRHARKLKHPTAYTKYDRTITRLAFASDSSVLVSSDLSGCLDSWVLDGHEDVTAPAVDVIQNTSKRGSSRAGSQVESDSEASDDDDDAVVVFYGQHWTDNPAGHLLPRLDSAPTVLTFRPQASTGLPSEALVNGNPGVHATRHNPHAHSHSLPTGRHRLWIMTARQQMLELDVLAGRLSEWSRRNPSEALPDEFTRIMDKAVGAVWDITPSRERLWVYGHSWVFMLNVGGDLCESGTMAPTRKRRRGRKSEMGHVAKKIKPDSGAGGQVRGKSQQAIGRLGTVRRYEDGQWDVVDLERSGEEEDDDDDDDDDGDDHHDEVGMQQLLQPVLDGTDPGDEDVPEDQVRRKDDGTDGAGERRWWCTFTYRPILGMVPLEDERTTDEREGDAALEVVIVERPQWEVKKGT